MQAWSLSRAVRAGLAEEMRFGQPRGEGPAKAKACGGSVCDTGIYNRKHTFGLSPVPGIGLLKPLEFFMRRVINVYSVRSLLGTAHPPPPPHPPRQRLVSCEANRAITGLEFANSPSDLWGGERDEDGV